MLATGCISPATEIQLFIDTDAPANQAMTVEVFSFVGTVAPQDLLRRANAVSTGNLWLVRDAFGAGTFRAGGSIGVLPPRDRRDGRDSTVTLWLRGVVAATPTSPEIRVDRAVSFSFIQNRSGTARVFLSVLCGAQQVGCLTVPAALCTQSVKCREQNATCGDLGQCVVPEVNVNFMGGDGGASDARADVANAAMDVPNRPVCDGGMCMLDCPAPNQICGAGAMMTCVDTRADDNNCGACGNACNGNRTCRGGSCACNPGTTQCMGSCVDLSTSAANCGMCGNSCNGGTSCQAGACACPAGRLNCNGTCRALATDLANCGSCGRQCAAGATCVSGACVCPMGGVACSGTCRLVASDETNCGACGNQCAAGATCVAGTCRCPAGQSACAGSCVTLATDENNCGTCGTRCAARANAAPFCIAGSCELGTCNAGFGNCDGNEPNGCETNVRTAPLNCGSCGVRCAARPNAAVTTCTAGVCGFTCNAGFGNCDGNVVNGCEVNLQTNASNCGRCGMNCPIGLLCIMGGCR